MSKRAHVQEGACPRGRMSKRAHVQEGGGEIISRGVEVRKLRLRRGDAIAGEDSGDVRSGATVGLWIASPGSRRGRNDGGGGALLGAPAAHRRHCERREAIQGNRRTLDCFPRRSPGSQ
jgi:hypothetical protein